MSPKTQEALPRVGEPRLVDRAARRVVVARSVGEPSAAAHTVIPSLYRAVYALKMRSKRAGADFHVEPLRARWPNAHHAPRAEWEGEWALPVPDGIGDLPPSDVALAFETWAYGPCAEILHEGSYATEGESVRRLQALVEQLGYDVIGPHEEEYLTPPDAPRQLTLIRWAVRKRF
jgi:hypothetical protein